MLTTMKHYLRGEGPCTDIAHSSLSERVCAHGAHCAHYRPSFDLRFASHPLCAHVKCRLCHLKPKAKACSLIIMARTSNSSISLRPAHHGTSRKTAAPSYNTIPSPKQSQLSFTQSFTIVSPQQPQSLWLWLQWLLFLHTC